jgi:formylglycine-generating enzyme required for sulfatase activity
MPIRRFLSWTVLAVAFAFAGTSVSAQSFVVRGGPTIVTNPSAQVAESGEVAANVQAGARFWLTELFQLQGTVGYNNWFTTEGAVYFRPFVRSAKVEPYAFAGFGLQFDADARRRVVPAGLGVEYHAKPNLGVFFEMAARWQSERNPSAEVNNLDFGIAPSVGISYKLTRRPDLYVRAERSDYAPSAEPAVAEAEPVDRETAPDETSARPMPMMQPTMSTMSPEAWSEWTPPQGNVEDLGQQVRVPDGTFVMGLTDEDPLLLQTAGLKRVTVSSFVMDKHEVTNAEYRTFMNQQGGEQSGLMPDASAWARAGSASSLESYFQNSAYDDYPVVAVSWSQASSFCQAQGGRLPTEAEWEYAARSGLQGNIYPWPGFEPRDPQGNYLANFSPGRGVYAADGFAFTAPVEAFMPTMWGLFNVSGNVAEWVKDSYVASYSSLSNFNPHYEDEGEPRRVVRGGSWASDDFYIGVGVRDAQAADEANIYTGFRCAYNLGARIDDVVETGAEADDSAIRAPIIAEDPTN